jgi:Gnt-I system high-affinity gluconate transporter
MMAALSVTHGFLPPHPSPMTLVIQFRADITKTFLFGLCLALPAIIIAGPLFSGTLKNLRCASANAVVYTFSGDKPPGIFNSLVSSLLPVLIIGIVAVVTTLFNFNQSTTNVLRFFREPNVVMGITIIIVTISLGTSRGKPLSQIMKVYTEAVKDIAMVLLIIGSAGILKQIFVDSGASAEIAAALSSWQLPPLLLAWVVAAILRLCLGSATIAGLTAAGIIYPLTAQSGVDPNLMVLAIGAGSLFFSHVNDTAFWMFKEYFGLSIKDTFRSWTLMETMVSIIGLVGVLILDAVVN